MEKFEGNWRSEPYSGYSYAYPHKTAYRSLDPPMALREVWAAEQRDALFLYLHVPFCEMRCGFCNLFTTINSPADFIELYLDALKGQALRVRRALGDARFARMAIGGGTPTQLSAAGLSRLFDLAREVFGVDPQRVPTSVETSPLTAEPEKLRLLRDRGVDRISIGVQSFNEAEVRAVGRSQRPPQSNEPSTPSARPDFRPSIST
jgi:oxygen-independent coproporphyrinogen III oxidase